MKIAHIAPSALISSCFYTLLAAKKTPVKHDVFEDQKMRKNTMRIAQKHPGYRTLEHLRSQMHFFDPKSPKHRILR